MLVYYIFSLIHLLRDQSQFLSQMIPELLNYRFELHMIVGFGLDSDHHSALK